MILEGLVTTQNADGSPNLSPMGPIVDPKMRQFVLRPFNTSRTYANLKRHEAGVLHVTDDVELFAKAAVGAFGSHEPLPPLVRTTTIDGWRLADCCRWFAFRVCSIDDSQDRVRIVAETVDEGRVRDFFGFNRAKHAVIEAAILATRIGILPDDEVREQLLRLASPVEKTAGPAELRAFEFLQRYVAKMLDP